MSLVPHKKIVVYFIDNDTLVYDRFLWDEPFNWNLHFYTSAPKLIQALKRRLPECLIIEANLKPYSGLQLYKELIHNELTPPTIFITTCGSITQAVEAMKLGALDYIEKPFVHSRLTASIKKLDTSPR